MSSEYFPKSYPIAEKTKKLGQLFLNDLAHSKYYYNFCWQGIPIIQYPQDIIALQMIIWETKPSLIIETGFAKGGSAILYSFLMSAYLEKPKVISIDIDFRDESLSRFYLNKYSSFVDLVSGSSVDCKIFDLVKSKIKLDDKVMVVLDSDHTHSHVLQELNFYSDLVTENCYLVVLDTGIEDMPNKFFFDRLWGKGNNPKTAVLEFLEKRKDFIVDKKIEESVVITSAPSGFLRKISSAKSEFG
ncbi:cephalosporin hydroxylase family protein [Allochromatium humboldtianum]|uniref:Cephalosporin hydroxylase family protein n=1 Tax=Allochromatium humboldtianum TaxID=504901 RepID=A0A850RGJ5_9GAMM|nr:cephalosporin hydroxylase family protein [Allochromatium humboldtianum]NVZ10282.1 cephalosporin hydroxylase family protein [Allochromatium humboldtianum]